MVETKLRHLLQANCKTNTASYNRFCVWVFFGFPTLLSKCPPALYISLCAFLCVSEATDMPPDFLLFTSPNCSKSSLNLHSPWLKLRIFSISLSLIQFSVRFDFILTHHHFLLSLWKEFYLSCLFVVAWPAICIFIYHWNKLVEVNRFC